MDAEHPTPGDQADPPPAVGPRTEPAADSRFTLDPETGRGVRVVVDVDAIRAMWSAEAAARDKRIAEQEARYAAGAALTTAATTPPTAPPPAAGANVSGTPAEAAPEAPGTTLAPAPGRPAADVRGPVVAEPPSDGTAHKANGKRARPEIERTDLNVFLAEVLWPKLFSVLDTAFPEFGFASRGTKKEATLWPADFPIDARRKAGSRLSCDPTRPSTIYVHGHHGMRWLEYVNGGRPARGDAFKDALRTLCEKAGVPYPLGPMSDHEIRKAAYWEHRRDLMAGVLECCQDVFWSEQGAAARAYMRRRGFTDDDLRNLGAGLYPDLGVLRKYLEEHGYQRELLNAAGYMVLKKRLVGYVLLPWNEAEGSLLTLYGHWPAKPLPLKQDIPAWRVGHDDGEPTIAKLYGLSGDGAKAVPMFLDRARRAGHREELIAVEGLFDGALLQCRGETNVVAYVGKSFSNKQVKTLARYGYKRVIVVPDPDKGGDDGALTCIRALRANGIDAYVARRLPHGFDPDEFLIEHGVAGWRRHVADPVPGARHEALHSLGDVTTASPDIERRKAARTLAGFARTLTSPLDRDEVLRVAMERTGFGEGAIRELVDGPAGSAMAKPSSNGTGHAPDREAKATPRRGGRFTNCHVHYDGPPIYGRIQADRETRCREPGEDDDLGDDPAAEDDRTYYDKFTDAELGIVPLASVAMQPISWLWPYRLEVGGLALMAGDAGIGKSQVLLKAAAVVSTGGQWPGGEGTSVRGNVVILAAEDRPDRTIRPRLEAMGANIHRITILKAKFSREVKVSEGKSIKMVDFMTFQDRAYWATIFDRIRDVRLFIVDPLPSYLGRGVNDSKNQEIRAVLEPFLEEVIWPRDICMWGNTHLNKTVDLKTPLHRVSGSIAYGALPRNVHFIVRDPEDPNRRYFKQAKCNDAPDDLHALPFRVEEKELVAEGGEVIKAAVPIFEAEGVHLDLASTMSPSRKEGGSGKKDACAEWLRQQLAAGPVPSNEIKARAKAAGFGRDLLWSVKDNIGVRASRANANSPWFWTLPDPPAHPEDDPPLSAF